MRNRAKCKLCGDIIESCIRSDHCECSCEHIGVSGGPELMYGHAIDFSNFLRVDDEGVEHSVTFVDKSKNGEEIIAKDDVPVEMASEAKRATVDKMIEYYEGLPQHALLAPATGYDLKAIYVLLKMLHS